jgi:hypothetical protein
MLIIDQVLDRMIGGRVMMVEASGHGRTAGPKRGSRVLPDSSSDSSVRDPREDPRESFLKNVKSMRRIGILFFKTFELPTVPNPARRRMLVMKIYTLLVTIRDML